MLQSVNIYQTWFIGLNECLTSKGNCKNSLPKYVL